MVLFTLPLNKARLTHRDALKVLRNTKLLALVLNQNGVVSDVVLDAVAGVVIGIVECSTQPVIQAVRFFVKPVQ